MWLSLALAWALLLLSSIVHVVGSEDVIIASSGDPSFVSTSHSQLPSSGYIMSKITSGQPLAVKISRKVNKPVFCQTIIFTNLPNPNNSPLIGPPSFELMTNGLYNDKYAWTNGKEVLSFVPGDDDGGTWIIGNEPGIDSGFVYLKPKVESMIPAMLETEEIPWYWLLNKKWTPQPQMKVVCGDDSSLHQMPLSDQSFYKVEYFDPQTSEAVNSILVPAIGSKLENQAEMFPDYSQVSLWNKNTGRWMSLSNVETVCTFGTPSVVIDTNGRTTVAHLVNEEHSGEAGWRLTFRRGVGTEDDAKFGNKDEILIEFGSNGGRKGASISMLQSKLKKKYRQNMLSSLSTVSKGDFVWLWYSYSNSSDARTNHTDYHIEVLLECLDSSDYHAVFEYYLQDRRDAMQQTVLSKDTNFFVMTRTSVGVTFADKGQPVQIHGAFNLGSDIIGFIRKHLDEKEGVLGSMSSCYLYHAAVSLPRSLVYAAEIVCVLTGAKPVTMIQYTSSSDNQWKFPLVQKLVRGIVAAKALLGDDLDINFHVNKYNNDESLIMYRSNRKYLADALAPFTQAQALHPVPYPDRENPKPDWEAQIYYSWWNGYVLGYPESFIDSYCRTFHNGLSEDEKMQQAALAKKDVLAYFASNLTLPDQTAVLIKRGLDASVPDSVWAMLQK